MVFPIQSADSSPAHTAPPLRVATAGEALFDLIEEPDGRLRPNMFADVEIMLGQTPIVQVPEGAVIDTGDRQVVVLDLGEGRFRPEPVTVGRRGGGMIEIVEPDGRGNRAVLGQVAHQFRRPVERAAADIGDGDRARVFRFLHRNIQGLRLWGGPQDCPLHRRPFSS